MSDYYAQTLEARRKMKLRIVIYFTTYLRRILFNFSLRIVFQRNQYYIFVKIPFIPHSHTILNEHKRGLRKR